MDRNGCISIVYTHMNEALSANNMFYCVIFTFLAKIRTFGIEFKVTVNSEKSTLVLS